MRRVQVKLQHRASHRRQLEAMQLKRGGARRLPSARRVPRPRPSRARFLYTRSGQAGEFCLVLAIFHPLLSCSGQARRRFRDWISSERALMKKNRDDNLILFSDRKIWSPEKISPSPKAWPKRPDCDSPRDSPLFGVRSRHRQGHGTVVTCVCVCVCALGCYVTGVLVAYVHPRPNEYLAYVCAPSGHR